MSNAFVVNNGSSTPVETCKTILGFSNLISSSAIGGVSWPAAYPFLNCFDNKSNTEWSPVASSGSMVIEITQSYISTVNYFGLFSKNASTAGLTVTVEVFNNNTGAYKTVGTAGSMTNGKPIMFAFDDITSYKQRVTLTWVAPLFISAMNVGYGLDFGRTMSFGAQPAHLASLDKVEGFTTEGNHFIAGRRISNGYQMKGQINFVSFDIINARWPEYMNHVLDSKPVFLMWNTNKTDQVIYGIQNPETLTKPSYKSNNFGEIQFDINGFA